MRWRVSRDIQTLLASPNAPCAGLESASTMRISISITATVSHVDRFPLPPPPLRPERVSTSAPRRSRGDDGRPGSRVEVHDEHTTAHDPVSEPTSTRRSTSRSNQTSPVQSSQAEPS
ncbi:hypothetical protein K3495_g7718 [Podosphaera aphanis]|nr:hypothetical protein K3495_g7718 [Podosphaera aphanis]